MQVPGGQGLQYFFSDGNQNIEVQGDIGDSDIEYFEDDDELDREGNPLPSPEEIVAIINSIPSYRYEEAKFEEDLEKSMIMSSRYCFCSTHGKSARFHPDHFQVLGRIHKVVRAFRTV